eukprot:3209793-Amphidinium_carterae.2
MGGFFLCPCDLAVNPSNRHLVQRHGSPETLTLGIASGAAVCIIPREACSQYPLDRSALGTGKHYSGAGGEPIVDEGRKCIAVDFDGLTR